MIGRIRNALFRYFSSYHEQRATHYRKLVEQLERDLIDSAKSEGEALTRERKLLEDVKQLRGELARLRTLEGKPGADVVELHPPHRPLTMPDVPRED